ncbi:MAG: alpha/beta hydrolase, partial [Hymenobacteraceae bacterium]|nr:alpha/beta hydrolase [Hymenobacteraceae bacterium]
MSTALAQQAHTLTGTWLGKMKVKPDLQLTVAFEVKPDGSALMHSVDQQVYDIKVDALEFQDGQVQMRINTINGTYKGQLVNPDSISGGINQGGGKAMWALALAKVDRLPNGKPKRPQEPVGELPYKAEDVTYRNEAAGVTLAGTLTIPNTPGPHPTLLLIPGSGPSDRDQTIFGHKVFLVWADQFTRAGYAVLRADDRGVGGSTGKYEETTVQDFASDAAAAVRYLKTRREVDTQNIGLIGHSYGVDIAPLAAAQSTGIAFVVLMSGAAEPNTTGLIPSTEAVYRQAGASEEAIALNSEILKAAFRILRTEPDVEDAKQKLEKQLQRFNPQLARLSKEDLKKVELASPINPKAFYKFLTPGGRSELLNDPTEGFRQLKCPVLAVNGTKDVQVLPYHLPLVEKAIRKGGNKNVTVKMFESKNHLFQTAKTGSIPEYAEIEETIAPDVVEYVVNWMNSQRVGK